MTAAVREQIAHEPAAKGVEAGPALLEALGRSAWAPVEQEESSRVGHLSVSWGPKYGVEDLGEYQDFCSICRNVEVFLIMEDDAELLNHYLGEVFVKDRMGRPKGLVRVRLGAKEERDGTDQG